MATWGLGQVELRPSGGVLRGLPHTRLPPKFSFWQRQGHRCFFCGSFRIHLQMWYLREKALSIKAKALRPRTLNSPPIPTSLKFLLTRGAPSLVCLKISVSHQVISSPRLYLPLFCGKYTFVHQVLWDALRCAHPGGSDEKLVSACCTKLKAYPSFVPAKLDAQTSFNVKHTIGSIKYNAQGFIFKNKDVLRPEMVEVVQVRLGGPSWSDIYAGMDHITRASSLCRLVARSCIRWKHIRGQERSHSILVGLVSLNFWLVC